MNSGKFARGTQNFTGGLATINDASGTRYQEVVTLPNGAKFVAYGRNVTLPLPRHTKIETAMQSARNYSIPRFAGGTTDFGGAANRINQLNPQTFAARTPSTVNVSGITNNMTLSDQTIERLGKALASNVKPDNDRPIYLIVDGKVLGQVVGPMLNNANGKAIQLQTRGVTS